METAIQKKFTIIQDAAELYHSKTDYIGAGGLKLLKRSPLHYLESEKKITPAIDFGKAYHSLILTPELFKKEYFIFNPDDRPEPEKTMASNANKAWRAELEASYPDIISADTLTLMNAIKQRLKSDHYIKSLLSNGKSEISHYVENFEGAKVKIRCDYIKDNVIVDLKTCQDASTDAFKNHIANYDYHIQAALYSDVAEYCDGKKRRFIFIAQEKEPPFDTNIIQASEQMLAVGRFEYEILITQWLKCLKNKKFRGYSIFADNKFGVTEVDLPAWKVKDLRFYDL